MSSTDSNGGAAPLGGKRFCLTISCEGMMKRGPAACATLLERPDGTKLTGPEAYALLWQAWLDGREVFSPACDNHDAKGHCLGHEMTG